MSRKLSRVHTNARSKDAAARGGVRVVQRGVYWGRGKQKISEHFLVRRTLRQTFTRARAYRTFFFSFLSFFSRKYGDVYVSFVFFLSFPQHYGRLCTILSCAHTARRTICIRNAIFFPPPLSFSRSRPPTYYLTTRAYTDEKTPRNTYHNNSYDSNNISVSSGQASHPGARATSVGAAVFLVLTPPPSLFAFSGVTSLWFFPYFSFFPFFFFSPRLFLGTEP